MSTNRNASGQAGANVVTYTKSSSNYNGFGIEQQFRNAMQAAGINYFGEVLPDGRLHRFHIDGHKRSSKNGAYILHANQYPAGWFMDFKTGVSQTWRSSSGSRVSYTLNKQIEEAKRQREAEQRQAHEKAATKAIHIWRSVKPATNHPYLERKGINPHGVGLYHDTLVIPIFDESDRLVNHQFIDTQGNKRFLSGGRKRGCFHVIGDPTDRILICEGFATGASLHEDSGRRVIVAFDAGNLLPVAKYIRDLSSDSEIIICGDNDESGIGQKKAREAALVTDSKILIPPKPGTDWNDILSGGYKHA